MGADLLDDGAPDQLVAAALEHFGRLDVLINNASTFYPTPVGKITRETWDDLLGSNLRAPLFLAQAAAPHLARERGLIINIVDIHGLRPLKGYPVYSIAKAGLAMLTRSLARELGPEVRVNGIAPGPVLWAEHGLDERMKRDIVSRTALKRTGSPEDIARTALFLARDAPYITGSDHCGGRRAQHLRLAGSRPLIQRSRGHARCRGPCDRARLRHRHLSSCAPHPACSA